MKIRVLSLLTIILSVLCLENVNAATSKKKCPAGLFCTSGGTYTYDGNNDIQAFQIAPAEKIVDGWGEWQDEQLCDSCEKSRSGCAYCANEYDEAWVSSSFGFYLVKDGEVTYHSQRGGYVKGVFPCPGTYPSSAEGASSVFECYRMAGNGQKEYYSAKKSTSAGYSGNYDIESINALVKKLQSSLDAANKAAQDLQDALDKANQSNQTNSKTNDSPSSGSKPSNIMDSKTLDMDIDKMKALINIGISDTKSNSKPGRQIRK